MGEEEVENILAESEVPLALREIAEKLDSTTIKVSMILKRMIKSNQVEIMEINKILAKKFYNNCSRMRLYYILK